MLARELLRVIAVAAGHYLGILDSPAVAVTELVGARGVGDGPRRWTRQHPSTVPHRPPLSAPTNEILARPRPAPGRLRAVSTTAPEVEADTTRPGVV